MIRITTYVVDADKKRGRSKLPREHSVDSDNAVDAISKYLDFAKKLKPAEQKLICRVVVDMPPADSDEAANPFEGAFDKAKK